MTDFLAALGLVFVLEGLMYGAFPNVAKRLAREKVKRPVRPASRNCFPAA